MSSKIKQALSLIISSTVVATQVSIPTFATSIEEQKHEISIHENVQEDHSIIVDIEENQNEFIQLEDTTDVEEELTQDEFVQSEEPVSLGSEEVVPYAAAANPYVVYTQITKSNSDRSGNGTAEHPYNRFEDAVANVADGGEIIIKTGRSGFINAQDEYGQVPFIIDKDVTIRSESSSEKAVLNVRAGGIILEGNVTFKDIEFAFANKVHDGIFANGYTLEVIDCVRGAGAREIDLFAGSLYNTSGNLIDGMKYTGTHQGELVTPEVGTNGEVIIKTTEKSTTSQFGKVFAGSMNGNFDSNANIEIVNNGNLDLVGIYACGGHEAKAGHMFDIEEPLPPEARPNDYRVNGTVNISMDNYISDINGKGADEVNVELSTKYPAAYFKLDDINAITIDTGRFIPDEITWKDVPGDVKLASKDAHLDLSEIKNEDSENKFVVHNFNGGGVLTLNKEGEMTINGEITGETIFQTVGEGINNSFSGIVIPEYTYIVNPSKTGSENSFKFTPSNLQRGCTLELDDATGNWTTSAIDTILPDTITRFDFIKDEIMIDSHTKDFVGVYNTFEIESNLADHILDWYFNLPYELSVTGYDVDYDADNNEWQFPAANLKFYITEDYDYMLPALAIAPITIEQPITPGKYEVKFSLSDYGVSSNYILNVVSDASTSDIHNLDITITNNTSNNGHICFGDQITIDTNINKSPNLIETLVLENEYEFYVNDKLVYSGIEDNHTLTIEKALFNEGENVIKVLYGGSNTVERLIGSTVVDVKKSEHVINLPLELNVTYDGKPHALTATIETLPDVEPIVYYYTDSAYTAGETTTPPVNVGTYYVKAVLPENEYYTAQEVTGTITIQKATPKLSLSGIPKNNNDLEVSVSMLYPKAGQIPNGKIQLNLVDAANSSQSSTVELKNGSLTHTFKNVAPGTATVIATYIPEINENGFVYNDPYYNEVKDVSETFEVVKDYIPVQDIEFIAPELQFYVQLNEVDYQNLTDMQLPVVITPNNASNQAITWTSSDPSVITINADGKVEAHKPGQSIITAIAKGANVMHTCEVRVLEMTEDIKPVKSISFDKLSMNLDLTTQLSGVINATLDSEPADIEPTNTDITWKSMDTSVAQIEATSDSRVVNVVAKGEGTTTVIAVTKDGAKVATCEVTVTQDQLGSGGDSDSSIPDTEKPEGNQPEVDSPETDDTPEGDKPEVDSPETDDTPEGDKPGVDSPETDDTPEGDKPEVDSPETETPGGNQPEVDSPETEIPEGDKPEVDSPETEIPEGDKPEVDSPETETPGGNQPETNKPEVDETPNNGGSGSGSGGSSNNNSNSSSGSRPSGGVSEGSNSTKTETDTTEDTISSDSNQQSTITIEKFTDIQNHWAKDDIQFVIEKGLFKGISETHFGVNQCMTRGMFVTVLHRLSGEPQVGKALFSDVKSNFYYADAVSWAHELGVVSGVNQTKFMPEQNITREQLVVMLYKYARAVSNNFEEYQEEISQFKDAKSVSNWSKDAMEWAVGAKILKGDTNNQLKPKANITRGEVAVILKRFCDKVVRN